MSIQGENGCLRALSQIVLMSEYLIDRTKQGFEYYGFTFKASVMFLNDCLKGTGKSPLWKGKMTKQMVHSARTSSSI